MQRPILEHAVIFIDQDIVFEKAGTGSLNPYRLTDLSTVEREWKPSTKGGLFTWHLRRPSSLRNMKSFAEEFSLMAKQVDARWPSFWKWPDALQKVFTLGVSDNPRNLSAPIDELTLLKAQRYELCQGKRWEPCHKQEATV